MQDRPLQNATPVSPTLTEPTQDSRPQAAPNGILRAPPVNMHHRDSTRDHCARRCQNEHEGGVRVIRDGRVHVYHGGLEYDHGNAHGTHLRSMRPCFSKKLCTNRISHLIGFIGSHPWRVMAGCVITASATTPMKRGRKTLTNAG